MSNFSLDVLGIGDAIVDIITEVDRSFLEQNNIIKPELIGTRRELTKTDVKHFNSIIEKPQYIPGGGVASSMAGIAALGGNAAFWGSVNNDYSGHLFNKDLKKYGVCLPYDIKECENYTSSCHIFVTPDAERTMCTYLGASREMDDTQITDRLLKDCHFVYFESCMLDDTRMRPKLIKLFQRVREQGTKVVINLIDVNWVLKAREQLMPIFYDYIDMVICNKLEAKALVDEEDLDKTCMKMSNIFETSSITLGEKGALVFDQQKKSHIHAIKTDNVIDTTGAGDLFATGLLFGLSQGGTLSESAEIGVKLAAQVIQHFGGRPQMDLTKSLLRRVA